MRSEEQGKEEKEEGDMRMDLKGIIDIALILLMLPLVVRIWVDCIAELHKHRKEWGPRK